jgi:aflatoxin B1 aldehyde reductase
MMTFGGDESAGARITDLGETGKILDLFQSRGYNEIDTARVYVNGTQEAWTRDAGWKDRGLTLATKVKYPNEPGVNTPDKVLESAELSLKELGAETVDVRSTCVS